MNKAADAVADAVLGPEEDAYDARLREEQKALEKAEKEMKKAVAAARARTDKARKKDSDRPNGAFHKNTYNLINKLIPCLFKYLYRDRVPR